MFCTGDLSFCFPVKLHQQRYHFVAGAKILAPFYQLVLCRGCNACVEIDYVISKTIVRPQAQITNPSEPRIGRSTCTVLPRRFRCTRRSEARFGRFCPCNRADF